MARSFLDIINGRWQQVLAIISSSGVPDANKIVATGPDGRLDASLMPAGFGVDARNVVTSEVLAAGDLINIWNDSGTEKVRKADATAAGKEACGFVLSSAGNGATVLVYFEGRITGLSGLTPGTRYYLSAASPGGATVTPPNATGNVVQFVGVAVSATEIAFEATDGIILA